MRPTTRPTRAFALPLLLLASLALLVGCGGAIPRPDDALSQPVDVISQVDARMTAIDDVRLTTTADYYDEIEGKRVAGRDVSILGKTPDRLRVTLSAFDKTMASMASNGVDFAMLDLNNKVYYHGPATRENISKLLPIYMTGGDFVRVLRGGFPTDELRPDWQQDAELGWNDDTGRYALELERRDGTYQLVELTHPKLEVATIRIVDSKNRELYSYEGKDFEVIDGVPVPSKSRFTAPNPQDADETLEVTLFIEKFETNVGLEDRIFTLKEPAGVQSVDLGSGM